MTVVLSEDTETRRNGISYNFSSVERKELSTPKFHIFRNEGEIQTFTNEGKLRPLVTGIPITNLKRKWQKRI